jgi:CDP-glucose 4,6-dehydratase
MIDSSFYKNKRVLITGHTGFKGTWLTKVLKMFGANIAGFSLFPTTQPSLFDLTSMNEDIISIIGDVRDYDKLKDLFDKFKPEIVFHLAAQPIVREGYRNPRETYEINIMGTINILECIRNSDSVKSFINVTTDKVYLNKETEKGYVEDDKLDGYDPYSNSKSCSDIVTHGYKNSFFQDYVSISTARAGNVIGGGDYAMDRIVPDCIRSAIDNRDIIVRNPFSVRPYQHVLEPIFAYILIAEKQYINIMYSGYYNVGPDEVDCYKTSELVDLFCAKWGNNLKWINKYDNGPYETGLLKLDCTKLKETFAWKPIWRLEKAIEKTIEFEKIRLFGGNLNKAMENQINEYLQDLLHK